MGWVMCMLVLVACDGWWPGLEGAENRGPKTKIEGKVFFADRAKFDGGDSMPLTAVDRLIGVKAKYRNTLRAMFNGPRSLERERGLTLLNSGAEGFENFELVDGVATLQLRGGCDGGGSDLTVFELIVANLKQYPEITDVRLFDPSGNTLVPEGPGDSKPACLQSASERGEVPADPDVDDGASEGLSTVPSAADDSPQDGSAGPSGSADDPSSSTPPAPE